MHLKEVVYTKYPDELLNNQDDPKGNHHPRMGKKQLYELKHLSSRRKRNQTRSR
jgi:hypothetical protein